MNADTVRRLTSQLVIASITGDRLMHAAVLEGLMALPDEAVPEVFDCLVGMAQASLCAQLGPERAVTFLQERIVATREGE